MEECRSVLQKARRFLWKLKLLTSARPKGLMPRALCQSPDGPVVGLHFWAIEAKHIMSSSLYDQ